MNEAWTIQLLGGLRAIRADRTVTRFRTQKTGALLAYLALKPGISVAREVLLDVIWPESDLDAGRNSLSVALSSLRRQLEPPAAPGGAGIGAVLIADRATVRLNPDAVTTDVAAFHAALREAAGAESGSRRIDALSIAVEIYAGELLPGLYDDWIVEERERLSDLYLQAVRRLTTSLMEAREFDRALDYAHMAVQADPLSEEPRRILMRLYAAIGRPSMVIEEFRALERARIAADDEPPSPEIRELAFVLAEGTDKVIGNVASRSVSSDLPAAAVTPPVAPARGAVAVSPSPPAIPLHLPAPFTRFFGRTGEIEQILEALRGGEQRLVTLTGTGGAGKTRLAVESARQIGDAFAGGVWFVPLADATDPARIWDAIAAAMVLPPLPPSSDQDPEDQVVARLAEVGACLLVLDNLEHLLGKGPLDKEGAAATAGHLLRRVPALRLLVTSRQALGLAFEREISIQPLPVPADAVLSPQELLAWASIQLFVDRAQARRVDFQITERNAASIAALCRRLEGLPLAIELAAAWAKLVTPSQMLERLEKRFDLLVSRRGDVPSRHRTMRAAIEWGYDLLTPEVQRLFTRLSIFRGGWTVEGAEAVCAVDDPALSGRIIESLTALRDASMTVLEEVAFGKGTGLRMRFLETLQEFAAEMLPESDRARLEERHAAYFLRLAEDAEAQAQGREQALSFDRLEADHDNLRAVLDRFESAESVESALRLAGALAPFWKIRGHLREGTDRLTGLLRSATAANTAPGEPVAKARKAAGNMAYERGDLAAAHAWYQASLDVYRSLGDRTGIAALTKNSGNVAYHRGDYAAAAAQYQEALVLFRDLGDRWGIASSLGNLANVAQAVSDFTGARQLQEECLALARELGDQRMVAYTLHNLGNLAQEEGDWPRARALYAESLPMKRELGDRRGATSLLVNLALLAIETDDVDTVPELVREALDFAADAGGSVSSVLAIESLAYYAAVHGQPLWSARLMGACAARRAAQQMPHVHGQESGFNRGIAMAREAAGSGAFEASWRDGEALPFEVAIAEARTFAAAALADR